jgi:hypothetical protein
MDSLLEFHEANWLPKDFLPIKQGDDGRNPVSERELHAKSASNKPKAGIIVLTGGS